MVNASYRSQVTSVRPMRTEATATRVPSNSTVPAGTLTSSNVTRVPGIESRVIS
jgi:hypothetical protein